jgi:hypothetical protein
VAARSQRTDEPNFFEDARTKPCLKTRQFEGFKKKPNAQVNRQKCEAFLSVLNLQLGWWQMRGWPSPTHPWVYVLVPAQLFLTWNAISVTIHFYAGTVG